MGMTGWVWRGLIIAIKPKQGRSNPSVPCRGALPANLLTALPENRREYSKLAR